MLIGLIADTHGLVRPEVFAALAGVSLILHAGDVGGTAVLTELRAIAPLRAVFGNVDAPGDPSLESEIHLDAEGLTVHVSHGHELGRPTVEALLDRYSETVIVYGHTHKALIHEAGSRLVINPGAAGPRRFDVKPSVARLEIREGRSSVELVWL